VAEVDLGDSTCRIELDAGGEGWWKPEFLVVLVNKSTDDKNMLTNGNASPARNPGDSQQEIDLRGGEGVLSVTIPQGSLTGEDSPVRLPHRYRPYDEMPLAESEKLGFEVGERALICLEGEDSETRRAMIREDHIPDGEIIEITKIKKTCSGVDESFVLAYFTFDGRDNAIDLEYLRKL